MKKVVNIGWLSVAHVVRLTISFLITIQVIRYLGPDRFGLYSYVFSVVGLLAPLTVFGLEQIVMRRLIASPERADEIVGSALTIRFTGAAVAIVGSISIVYVLDGWDQGLLSLVSLAALLLLFMPLEEFADILRAREKMAGIAIPQIIAAVAVAGVTLLFVVLHAELESFVALRSVETAVAGVGFVLAYGAIAGRVLKPRLEWGLVRVLVRDGWPLLLSSFSVIIYMRIDQVMLKQMTTPAVLGYYAAAVRLSELFFFVPMAISAAFYADLVRAHHTGENSFANALQRYYDVMTSICYALLAFLLVGGTVGLEPLLGPAYTPVLPVFQVLVISLVFVGLGVAQSSMLTIRGWLWTSAATTAIGAVANITLNLILIPTYGAIGAAWATVASYWLASHGMSLLLPALRPMGLLASRSLNPLTTASRLFAR